MRGLQSTRQTKYWACPILSWGRREPVMCIGRRCHWGMEAKDPKTGRVTVHCMWRRVAMNQIRLVRLQALAIGLDPNNPLTVAECAQVMTKGDGLEHLKEGNPPVSEMEVQEDESEDSTPSGGEGDGAGE